MITNNPLIKPFLKWAGGKRQLLAEIRKHLPGTTEDYTYYEPFVGAGAVFFDLQPKKAVINDLNAELMLTYTTIKNNPEDLIALLKLHQKNHGKEYYYEMRNMDRDAESFNRLTNAEKTARLIYLNKTCFNGLYRVNSRGLFNVPYGRYKNPAICEDDVMRHVSTYLNFSEIIILNGDFEQAVSTADEKSFVYFDPPYYNPDKTGFTAYQANGFDANEQKRLRDVMRYLTERGVKCLLSNSDTEYIRELYSQPVFEIIPVKAIRAINSDPGRRGVVGEVLIRNWKE